MVSSVPDTAAPETAAPAPSVAPVDERLPLPRLVPLAFQHLLAGVAAPVSSVILIGTTLSLSASQTASLLSATLVLCGIGALLQSLGVKALRIGARLPFLMLPGGAAVAIFLQVAKEHGPATASGSVLIAAVFLIAVLPLYGRLVRFFPPLVMGTTVVLIGINMIKITAPMIASGPGLGFATLGITAVFFLFMRGVWRQMSVLFGLAGGTLVAALTGTAFHMAHGSTFALPDPFPYGTPHFDLLAAVPLLVFALASLAEATGQTVLNSEAVGRTPDAARDVPRISRADAVTSLGAACLRYVADGDQCREHRDRPAHPGAQPVRHGGRGRAADPVRSDHAAHPAARRHPGAGGRRGGADHLRGDRDDGVRHAQP